MKKITGLIVVMALLFSMPVYAGGLPVVTKTDRFDVMDTEKGLSMASRDGKLIIHVDDGAEIVFEDGTDARGRLAAGQTLAELLDGRNLTVHYSVVAQSLPPQATPGKIEILYETAVPLPANEGGDFASAVPPIYEFKPGEIEALFPLNGEIVVDGGMIEAPAPYYNDGVIMVPLRAIASALGFDVAWENAINGVRLGVAINLWIGKDYYTVGRMAPIKLVAAPEIHDGHTFVPMTFFREVVKGYTIYSFEGQVVIEAASADGMW